METIKTKMNKEFLSDFLATIPFPARAYIRVFAPITTVASVFSNPEETERILYGETNLEGYSRLVSIIPEEDAIKVCLAKD